MIVTITTDASFRPDSGIGSYAFAIVSNLGRVYKSGVLRRKVHRPEVAEFRCIVNAVFVLAQQNWHGIEKIVINTDCMNVIHLINNDKAAIKKYGLKSWGAPIVKEFRKHLRAGKLDRAVLSVRHVKAHTNADNARSFVNDWCDRAAKEAIHRYLIEQKKNENGTV